MEAIVFDVDGTLWDTTEVVATAWNEAVFAAGATACEITADTLKREFGKPMNVIAKNIFPHLSEEMRELVLEKCCELEHERVADYEGELLYPNVRETIIALSKFYKIGIVSNCQKGYIELFLEKNRLADYVMDIECYGNTGKSKGENIRMLMERNQVEDAVYVGDTKGDSEAAMFAGIPFIFASYGFGSPEQYDKKIERIEDLVSLFCE